MDFVSLREFEERDDNASKDEVERSTNIINRSNSVTPFSWPMATVSAKVADDKTVQETGKEPVETFSDTDELADPIRGPPDGPGTQNNLFFTGFLNSGDTDPDDQVAAALHQMVIIDPVVDDVSVLANGISGPGIGLLTLSDDTDPLSQIEAAIDQFGQVSAVHIFSHGSAGKFSLGRLTIDEDLLAARADSFAQWAEFLIW